LFSSRTEAKNTGFDDFSEIRKTIEKYHPAPTDEKIKDSLIHALVQSYGDKYTTYFSPNELLSFQTMIDGDFE
jgi:C-terminal processing protease CtpA/Prc